MIKKPKDLLTITLDFSDGIRLHFLIYTILFAIRAKDGEMLLNTLFFNEEVKKNPADKVHSEVKEVELKMAKSIMDAMTAPFEPEKYHDEYRKKFEVAIEQKITGKEIVAPKEKSGNIAATLMEALQASLSQYNKSSQKATEKEMA